MSLSSPLPLEGGYRKIPDEQLLGTQKEDLEQQSVSFRQGEANLGLSLFSL